MNSRITRSLAVLITAVLVSPIGTGTVRGQEKSGTPAQVSAAQEKEACIRNLKQIYSAIEAYQAERKDLPNWLSDLVPKYLSDATLLICPVCKRTGRTESAPLADPNLPSSYLFEFCPVPLGSQAPSAASRTRREWKRRQMGLLGSVVPIVRCRFHNPALNVSFDGKIYESPGKWELVFTNRASELELSPAQLFGDAAGGTAGTKFQYPERDPKADKELIDLSRFYNAGLSQSWHGAADNDLGALPTGIQTFAGIRFDVRGLIQLAGKTSTNWPAAIKGIPINQKCQRIHFLHSAGYGKVGHEGKTIGSYVVYFAANQMRLEIPIQYGQAVRDWHVQAGEPPSTELKVVWTGSNAVSKRAGNSLRLFLTTWTNLVPSIEIQSIDYVSTREVDAAPFLVAVTVD